MSHYQMYIVIQVIIWTWTSPNSLTKAKTKTTHAKNLVGSFLFILAIDGDSDLRGDEEDNPEGRERKRASIIFACSGSPSPQ